MSNNNYEDEISLKEIVDKLVDFKKLLLSKWKLVILASFIVGLVSLGLSFLEEKTYTADLTFVIESEDKKSGLGSYAGLASQFGINLGAGAGEGSVFDGQNLLELFKSRKVIEEVLLSEVDTVGGKSLALDYFFSINETRELWLEDSSTMNLAKLDFGIPRKYFTIKHDSIIDKVQAGILENLKIGLLNEEASIVKVSYTHNDERFAKNVVEQLIKVVGDLYTKTKTEKTNNNIGKMTAKVDSVKRELSNAEYALAKHKDNSYRTIKAQGYLQELRLTRDVEILNVMYAEVVKNLEFTSFTLMNQTPLIQVIDEPRYPLPYEEPSKKKALIIGLLMGGFIASLYVVIRKILSDLMKE